MQVGLSRDWWEKIRTGEYTRYYEEMYGKGGRHGSGAGEDS